jgi:hypothetical protein
VDDPEGGEITLGAGCENDAINNTPRYYFTA